MSREAAIEIIRERGVETPFEDMKKFSSFAGVDLDNFLEIAEKFRNHDIWKAGEAGKWHMPQFLISDWKW